MPDLSGSMKMSEKRNGRVTITPVAPQTTVSIITAVCTLYDSALAIAGGINAAVAEFDAGALAAPKVWYNVQPSVLGLTPGLYSLAFFVVDSTGQEWEPVIAILVKADGT